MGRKDKWDGKALGDYQWVDLPTGGKGRGQCPRSQVTGERGSHVKHPHRNWSHRGGPSA